MIRYKILGLALIAFIVIWAILFLRADTGFPKEMYITKDIDSLIIVNGKNSQSIQSLDKIEHIVNILGRAQKLTGIDRTNINTDVYHIDFYSNKSESPFSISILSNVYHGKIAAYRSSYYNGDSIDVFIKSIDK